MTHNEKTGVIGLHNFVFCEAISEAAKKIEKLIQEAIDTKDFEKSAYYLKKLKENHFKREKMYKNVVTLDGRTILARVISDSSYTDSSLINYGALGSGTSTPSESDTQLQTETFRKTIAVLGNTNNVAKATQFYGATEANTQHFESGEFIGATAIANSGTLFSRFSIDELKVSTETLTIESEYTITQ